MKKLNRLLDSTEVFFKDWVLEKICSKEDFVVFVEYLNSLDSDSQIKNVKKNLSIAKFLKINSSIQKRMIQEVSPFVIKYFEKPSLTIQKEAIKIDASSIVHIKELKNEAIQFYWNKKVSKNYSELDKWVEENRCSQEEMDILVKWLNQLSENDLIHIFFKKPSALALIQNQSKKLCKQAVINDQISIKYVKNQTKELCELAILRSPCSFLYIKEQTVGLCLLALELDKSCYKYVRIVPNPDFETTLKNLKEKKAILEAFD